METTTEPVSEPVEDTTQAVDTNPVANMFKKEFAEANPDLFDGVNSVTELMEKTLAKQKALVPPGEDASEADLTAYREANGIPDKADGYEFDESLGIGEEDVGLIRDVAHKYHASPAMATAMAEVAAAKDKAFADSVQAEIETAKTETLGALKKQYGEATPAKLEQARAVVARFGGDEFTALLESTGLTNHINMVETMLKIADAISEDSLDSGGAGANPKTNNFLDKSFPEG